MRTRKLLVPLILCCLCMAQFFIHCRGERHREKYERSNHAAKYREKNAREKYLMDFAERGKEEESEGEEEEYAFSQRHEGGSLLDRKNRAIDVPGSSEGIPGKSGQQSTPSNLPKESRKPSESSRERYLKHRNVTIGEGICQSIDIRNSVDNFDLLKDCRVIEGFLQITLMQNNTEVDFQNVSFPLLREITGYFLLYRVDKLKSLSTLFPNLEVIRGDTLLADYSFMIYEMQHLQEIGLSKLIEISRGAVRVEKNPSLCYLSTLDWTKIVVAGENFIKDNCQETACPVCTQCPGGHCWNAHHCQNIEKPRCHPECLGECYKSGDAGCYVCKNYQHEGRCVETCPPHLFAYLSRRCITKERCLMMNSLRKVAVKVDEEQIWRPFNGTCLTHCPSGYEDALDQNNMTTCRRCQGRCQKVGLGAIIRYISDAQRYRGTTIVNGALEFQIRTGHPNIINELTEGFGMIEEITGYLKITHSFPITSLSFFKSLRIIKGEQLDINNASLVVLDNPNLSNLFPDNQEIQIHNGRLFFHYNPKLCMSKIRRLGMIAGITNITDLEVQPDSNGEKVACDIVNININVKEKGSNYANLVWDVYVPQAGQSLLSYLLNYIETEKENVSYEGNSCGNNTWQIMDVEIPRSGVAGATVSQRLMDLKPYTRYAVYVKTFAARNVRRKSSLSQTGQSEIIFFRTESDVPSVPTDLTSSPLSDTEIMVKWGPPEYPNGPIGYYMLAGFVRLEDENLLSARNYCVHGLVSETELEPVTETPVETKPAEKKKNCCSKDATLKTSTSRKFEIFCLENMTITSLSTGRKNYCYSNRHNIGEPNFYGLTDYLSYPGTSSKDSSINDEVIDNTRTRMWNGTYYSFLFNVSANSTYYTLDKLRHFSLYTISVAACGRKLENGTQMCSAIEYTNSRTKKRENADHVRNLNVHVSNDTIVIVTWEAPDDPNGLTVAYTIEYTNLIVKDAKKSTECVSAPTHRQKRVVHYIKNLSSGKYRVRVRSISLAGEGTFSATVNFSIGIKEDNTVVIVVLLMFGFLLTGFVIAYLIFRNYQKKMQQKRLIASVNPDYIETTYVRDHWEVPRENIELLEELGLGNFGMVYRGILNGTTQVAVKTIGKRIRESKKESQKNEFLNEASVMKNFTTFHIIKLLGVVSEGSPPYVIMELMENGDLKTYLRKIREKKTAPEVSRVIRMACEIADGMAYLESKKFVHRDLAARNCMVSGDLVCKIGDFGMAREIYETDYYKVGKKGLLPIRWMAPENLSDGVFTSDSDVWSYGVVLYEILTLGEMPYQGYSNEEVLCYVLRRGTLTLPPNCPELIAKIVEKCFKWRPIDRPTFMELVAELEPFIAQDFCEKSFYHSEEGIGIRNLGLKKVYNHAAAIRFHWGNETARWVREFEDNVTLLDETKAGTSRGRIFKNGFQHLGNLASMEDVPLDR